MTEESQNTEFESLEDALEAEVEEISEDEIIISDLLDTLQGYEGAEPGESKPFYQKAIAEKHGMTRDEMLDKAEKGEITYEQQLEWTAEMIEAGELDPRLIPGIETIINFYKMHGKRFAIYTADEQRGADLAVKPHIEAGLVRADEVYGINPFGSKKKPETWVAAKQRYHPCYRVKAVYEDTEANLDAALKAYKSDNPTGYLVKELDSGISIVKTKVAHEIQ
tara:strand:- start:7138 stop:7803 length:666 start_codon:yes stop_codon:yes gene_type:complete